MRRREFPSGVKAEIVRRATNAADYPVCEGCGGVLKKGAFEIDHTIPDALVVDKTAPLTAKDGQLLGHCCHRGEDGKTAHDVADIARAKRREARHLGIPRSQRNLIPGSRGTRFKKKISGETVLR